MTSANKIEGLQAGALTHSGIENMIGNGVIRMGSAVELVTTAFPNGEIYPRVQETQGVVGSPLVYGIAVGGDNDGVYGVEVDAAAAASVGGGIVTGILVVATGSGYTSVPDVTFDNTGTGGSNAAADAILTDGKVTSYNVTNVGSGYVTGAPKVIITPSPDNSTSAIIESGQTVRVLTRGKCPARVSGGNNGIGISVPLTPSFRKGVLGGIAVDDDALAISLNDVLADDLDLIIIEVAKQGFILI